MDRGEWGLFESGLESDIGRMVREIYLGILVRYEMDAFYRKEI
jgi:hypothetical protein